LTWVSLGLEKLPVCLCFVSLGFTLALPLELGGGGKLLQLLALKVGSGIERGVPVNDGWLKVKLPVWDLWEKVGFGSVVKELENDGKVLVKVGLVKEPVKEDSWCLMRLEDGGGEAEWDPVGRVNVPVNDSVCLVNDSVGLVNDSVDLEKEPVGMEREGVGAECEWWEKDSVGLLNTPVKEDSWRLLRLESGIGSDNEPVGTLKDSVGILKDPVKELVGLECDSWLDEGKVSVPDGNPEKLPVGCGNEPVKDGTVKEDESARLLREPVNEGGGTLLWETDE
jgi:hypothetical protein